MKKVGGETRKNIDSHIEKAKALNILYDHVILGSLKGDPSGFLKVPSGR